MSSGFAIYSLQCVWCQLCAWDYARPRARLGCWHLHNKTTRHHPSILIGIKRHVYISTEHHKGFSVQQLVIQVMGNFSWEKLVGWGGGACIRLECQLASGMLTVLAHYLGGIHMLRWNKKMWISRLCMNTNSCKSHFAKFKRGAGLRLAHEVKLLAHALICRRNQKCCLFCIC